jgi:hypothetical protein
VSHLTGDNGGVKHGPVVAETTAQAVPTCLILVNPSIVGVVVSEGVVMMVVDLAVLVLLLLLALMAVVVS